MLNYEQLQLACLRDPVEHTGHFFCKVGYWRRSGQVPILPVRLAYGPRPATEYSELPNRMTLKVRLSPSSNSKTILDLMTHLQCTGSKRLICFLSCIKMICNLKKLDTYVAGAKSFRPDIQSRAKWKMLWGIYSAIYGDVNVSVEKCVEINGDYVEK